MRTAPAAHYLLLSATVTFESPCARAPELSSRRAHAERLVRGRRSQGERGDSRAERWNLEGLGGGDAGAAGAGLLFFVFWFPPSHSPCVQSAESQRGSCTCSSAPVQQETPS